MTAHVTPTPASSSQGISPSASITATALAIAAGRKRRARRRTLGILGIAIGVLLVFCVTLMVGRSFYSPFEVWSALFGGQASGASFTIGELRLPRATLGTLVGFAFGAAGATFQSMLRNPLASPDVIGISAGAGAAAVVGILVFSLNDSGVSLLALGGALGTALIIYALSHRGGFTGIRFILIGVGLAAMLYSLTSYLLSRAANWDIQSAMQWLAGSLNGASWERIIPLAVSSSILIPILLISSRDLRLLRLGDDLATSLGVRVSPSRLILMVSAVALLAFATAAAGPIAFVAFMAGPIAARLIGVGSSLILPAGFTGALLVLSSDLAGQFLFDERYPVGVITGVLGAPFLLILLIRLNRTGGAL